MDKEEFGIPEEDRPDAQIVGDSGNIFRVMGIASKALKRAGFRDEAEDMQGRILKAESYDQALQIIMHYTNPVSAM